MGIHSTYTKEIADEICERLSKGEPLQWICKDEHMPAVRTVSDWKATNEEFSANFTRARQIGFDAIAAQCIEIADDGTNDYMTIVKGNQQYNIEDKEVTSRSKLRVETRLKLLAKWYPQKYGDKVDVTTKGESISNLSSDALQSIADRINKNAKKKG